MSLFESLKKVSLRMTAVSLGYAVLPFVLLLYVGPEIGTLFTPIGGLLIFIGLTLTFGSGLQYVCTTKTRTASKYIAVVAITFAIFVYLFALYSNVPIEGSEVGTGLVLIAQAFIYLVGVRLGHRVYAKYPTETVYDRFSSV